MVPALASGLRARRRGMRWHGAYSTTAGYSNPGEYTDADYKRDRRHNNYLNILCGEKYAPLDKTMQLAGL